MDAFFQYVYVGEIKMQCEFALNAARSLNHVLQNLSAAHHPPDMSQVLHREVFRQIHSFLTHASNVSRLFWPPVPSRKQNESDAKYARRLSALDGYRELKSCARYTSFKTQALFAVGR